MVRPAPRARGGEPSVERHDVIVVGAGVGGLAVAALVAAAGRSVLLLDRAAQAGGVCRPAASPFGPLDLGPTILTGLEPAGPLTRLADRIGCRLPTQPCEPLLQVATPRHRFSLFTDPDRLWTEIRREFPAEEAAWRAFLAEVDDLAREHRGLLELLPPLPPWGWRARFRTWRLLGPGRWAGQRAPAVRAVLQAAATPLRATLGRHGLGPESQQLVEAMTWYLLLRDADQCSALEGALLLHGLRSGGGCLAGGSAALVEALLARLQAGGGAIQLETEVGGCLVEKGRVAGVVTAAGETLRAGWVVAAVPPDVLATRLLPPRRSWRARGPEPGPPWTPKWSAVCTGLTVPEAHVPTGLGRLCLVVSRADRRARGENLAAVRLGPAAATGGRILTVGRFGPAPAAGDDAGLLAALDGVLPGAAAIRTGWQFYSPAELGELWGRSGGVVRFAGEPTGYLGGRGRSHDVGWPGLVAAGAWTYPGRLVAGVAEGALRVADRVLGAG